MIVCCGFNARHTVPPVESLGRTIEDVALQFRDCIGRVRDRERQGGYKDIAGARIYCGGRTPGSYLYCSPRSSIRRFASARAHVCMLHEGVLGETTIASNRNSANAPGVRLVVEPNRGDNHGPVHANIPDILPVLLLSLLTGCGGLRERASVVGRHGMGRVGRCRGLTFSPKRKPEGSLWTGP